MCPGIRSHVVIAQPIPAPFRSKVISKRLLCQNVTFCSHNSKNRQKPRPRQGRVMSETRTAEETTMGRNRSVSERHIRPHIRREVDNGAKWEVDSQELRTRPTVDGGGWPTTTWVQPKLPKQHSVRRSKPFRKLQRLCNALNLSLFDISSHQHSGSMLLRLREF